MRIVQVTLFLLGVLSFLAAALFIGQGMGDILWRAGLSAMLTDLVCTALWPPVRGT